MLAEKTLELIEPFVFLSYTKADKTQVSRIYKRHKKDYLEPWIDYRHLLPGSDWDRVIRNAIRNCRFFAVFLSSNSISKRGYIQKEISEALDVVEELPEGRVFIIPIRLEDCEIPERLRKWQWIDIFKRGGYNKLRDTLIHQLGDDYIPPSTGKTHPLDLPSPSFKKPEDYVLFQHFVNEKSFVYAILGHKKYGVTDGKLLIIRDDLPDSFLSLLPVLSRTKKISRKSMLNSLPPKNVYCKPEKELRIIEPIKPHVLRLHPKQDKYVVHINPIYWRFVPFYCKDPKTYLVSPMEPVVVEDQGRPKVYIMPHLL